MFTAFLIKYAEIGIKGKNRYLFEDALVQQIKYALKKCEGQFKIHKTQGRIFVDALSEFDFDEVVELPYVSGIQKWNGNNPALIDKPIVIKANVIIASGVIVFVAIISLTLSANIIFSPASVTQPIDK